MNKQLKTIASIVLFGGFLFLGFSSGEEKKAETETSEERTTPSENGEVTNSAEQNTEPSLADKKVMCNRMFGGGDLSAWETAQAECMLQQSESACECMQILTQ
jgi:hypothetical protein